MGCKLNFKHFVIHGKSLTIEVGRNDQHFHGIIQYALNSGMKWLQYPLCLTVV